MAKSLSETSIGSHEALARAGTFQARDPSLHEQAVGPWQLATTPLSRRAFGFSMAYLVTPGITLYRERFAARTRLQGLSPAGVLGFTVPIELGRSTSFWGAPLHESGLPAMVDGGLDIELSAGQTQITVLIDLAVLRDTWPQELAERAELAARDHVLPASGEAIQRIGRELGNLLAGAQSDREMLQHPVAVRALQADVLGALARTLSSPAWKSNRQRRKLRLLGQARAIEYLRSADLALITVPEICEAAGISQRMLEYVFLESFGVSPLRLLQLLRYHACRSQLRAAGRESASVKQIAQANGFYQLGRFAVEYKALFGESPSVTLSRQPEVADHDLLRAHGLRQC